MKHPIPIIVKPSEGPLSSKALFELSLFSTSIFIFSALLMQFLLTFYTAMLLNLYDIEYYYRLFSISFWTESRSAWTQEGIFIVFGTGPIILSILGFIMLRVLKIIMNVSWKKRLVLSWLAFLLVNALPCGIVAAIFFFDSFGIAFQYLVSSYLGRGLVALVILIILLIFSDFWKWLFLNAAGNSEYIKGGYNQKQYIKHVFILPWFYGIIILMLFNFPFGNLYWPAFLVCLGYVALPIYAPSIIVGKPTLTDLNEKVFKNRYQILYIVIVLAAILLISQFGITV